jgi:hypothetical protein
MDLMQTPLGDEVKRIIDSKQGNPNVFLDAVIHTADLDVPVLKVLNFDLVREYSQQYSDELSLAVLVPKGKYAYHVVPSRNQLEITLTGAAMAQHGEIDPDKKEYALERFRAIIKSVNDPTLEASGRELLSESTMDLLDFEVVEFQLFSKAMEQFAMRSCGGIYRRTAVADLVRSLFLQQSNALDLEKDYKPLGVDMVDPYDTVLREHIILPHGLKVFDAPAYIHKYCGGIYSAGLSYYYQDDYWYVYPTYDYKNYEEAARQLVIVQIPENKLPNLDYTYMVEGSVTSILATGELALEDSSEARKRATGNGMRFADAARFFEVPVQIADNKALASRGKLNNEFISSQQKSELNNVVVSDNAITANTMYEASKLASKEGVHIQLIWQNSDPSLILPGMKAKIHYYKDGQVNQLNAIVIGSHSMTSYEGNGLVTGRFNRNTALLLFAANEANQST